MPVRTNYIDSVVGYSTLSWNLPQNYGKAYTLPYTYSPDWHRLVNVSGATYTPFDTAQQKVMNSALATWSNVANIRFQLTNNAAAAKMGIVNYTAPQGEPLGTVAGFAQYAFQFLDPSPHKRIVSSEVQINPSFLVPYGTQPGSYGYMVYVHEVGHTLGLKHTGNYNQLGGDVEAPYLTDFGMRDDRSTSIMSYNPFYSTKAGYIEPSTPMIYDIAAIQFLYGANNAYNSGHTTYTLTGETKLHTRWDGGGNDTILTSVAEAVRIDLREGPDYLTLVGNNYSYNAYGSNIENATSGNGNDTLYGNALANKLTSNIGNDSVYGGDGNDTILGGDGNDFLYGENGNDSILGGGHRDVIEGGIGNDTLKGEADNDTIRGGEGNDSLYGGDGHDELNGGNGNDFLFGNIGNDKLIGGAGVDVFTFSPGGGKDTITDFTEQDFVSLKEFAVKFANLSITHNLTTHLWEIDVMKAGNLVLEIFTNEFTGTWTADDFQF